MYFFECGVLMGKKVVVVGVGFVGLFCVYCFVLKGYDVVIFDLCLKVGGLNEYGIVIYKFVDNFVVREVDWLF